MLWMRKARSEHVALILSLSAFVATAYAASRFGLEGWIESFHYDVAPLGIKMTIGEPGFFRTELLDPESTFLAEVSIAATGQRLSGPFEFHPSKDE
jgi:NAD(P)-dependent dehydrogenase (short-subunit alcohol dehydrogenase family)